MDTNNLQLGSGSYTGASGADVLGLRTQRGRSYTPATSPCLNEQALVGLAKSRQVLTRRSQDSIVFRLTGCLSKFRWSKSTSWSPAELVPS